MLAESFNSVLSRFSVIVEDVSQRVNIGELRRISVVTKGFLDSFSLVEFGGQINESFLFNGVRLIEGF